MSMYRLIRLLLIVMLPSAAALAQTTDVPKIRFKQVCTVKANGDVDLVNDLTFPLKMYSAIKGTVTNTATLLRELGMTGQVHELAKLDAKYDDTHRGVHVTGTILGGMKNRGKTWLAEIYGAENFEVVHSDENEIILLAVSALDNGALMIGTTRIVFPEGTKNVHFEPSRGGVLCDLPAPKLPEKGTVDVDMAVQVRPEIMACLYKVYGNPKFTNLWVARAVFKNKGTAPVSDLQVRFRLSQYSAWSGWQRTKIVYPGQTVVEAFYPIMFHTVRDLKSATPETVETAWAYRTPDGQKVEESDNHPLTILGLNQTISSSLPAEECTTWFEAFNYAPLIGASFVSHTDPIMQRFAGMAAKVAGGAGASISNENAVKFMKAVYDLMCTNQIKYQSPPWLFQKGVRQHVKFGRDVLQNRAGTCIDLAITYASTCQAGGLDPCLMWIPGHCFPVIKLPKGGLLPVEATVINDNTPFTKAVEIGQKELNESMEKGLFYLVDVVKLRIAGVPVPELPDLPPSTLTDWDIKVTADQPAVRQEQQETRRQQPQPAPQPQPQPEPQPQPQPQPGPAPGNMKQVADEQGTFAFSVPADWQVQRQGQAVGAANPQQTASVSCAAMPRQSQSLQQYAQTMTKMWQQQVQGWTKVGERTLQLSGHQAVFIRATGTPGGQKLVADYFLVLTQQHQLLLMAVCKEEMLQQFQDIFQQIVSSWQIR